MQEISHLMNQGEMWQWNGIGTVIIHGHPLGRQRWGPITPPPVCSSNVPRSPPPHPLPGQPPAFAPGCTLPEHLSSGASCGTLLLRVLRVLLISEEPCVTTRTDTGVTQRMFSKSWSWLIPSWHQPYLMIFTLIYDVLVYGLWSIPIRGNGVRGDLAQKENIISYCLGLI